MTKIMMKSGVLAAALMVASAAAQAQGSHIPASTAGITVSGVWGTVGRFVGSSTAGVDGAIRNVLLIGSTPVAVPAPPAGTPQGAASTVRGVTSGDVGMQSLMTSTLQTSGVGSQAGLLVSALALLADGTAYSTVRAISRWNLATRGMNSAQMRALLSTPEGVAAVRVIKAAVDNFLRAGT